MAALPFTKMHGLGNCYIYIDGWQHALEEESLPELSRYVSNVSTGIGSDGLILMGPSKSADLKMRIFNKDGSEGKNCGNGLRCVAKYAYEHKRVKSRTMTIETGSGIVHATIVNHTPIQATVSVNMGTPRLSRSDIPMLGAPKDVVIAEPFKILNQTLTLTAVSMGNPHALFFIPDIHSAPTHTLGPCIEKDSRFPERVNVEFLQVENSCSIQCRVWERGSGATQACGTGACAAAVASILNGYSKKETDIHVHLEGGSLQIRWKSDDNILMTGPATTVASGTLYRS